jgi:DNA processing protein
MNETDLMNWFKLCTVKGLGPRKIIRLFDLFKDIITIMNVPADELVKSRIISEKLMGRWQQLKEASTENFEQIISDCKENNITIIPIVSKEYPEQLKFIPGPPMTLFVQGERNLLYTKKVAIVGSRMSDEKSKKWAFESATQFAKNGITVISGGAKGIDYEAHRGALNATGKTICVMGTGLLNYYPIEHKPLFNEIKEKGLLVSENLPKFTGSKYALLQRNRITSGLSNALIAVTCSNNGGVMTQLRHSYEQKIPIFCPKFSFDFSPIEGLKEKKQTYRIIEIENIDTVIEVTGKNIVSRQKILF